MSKRKTQRTQSSPGRATEVGLARSEQPGSGESLYAKLAHRLRERGLPLELRVAKALRAHGFAVTPSAYIQTSETRRPREIDARAVLTQGIMSAQISFELYVECKWSQDKPWVVYSSKEATPPPAIVIESTAANSMGEALLWLFLDDPSSLNHPPFFSRAVAAHGGARISLGEKGGGTGADMFYRTMQSVTAITRAGSGFRNSLTTMADQTKDARFAFPLVVIDGPLFEAFLSDGNDDIDVRPIDRARVFWRGAGFRDVTSVDLVTMNAIDAYASEFTAGVEKLRNDYLTLAYADILEALAKNDPDPLRFRVGRRRLGAPITFPTVIRALITKLADERAQIRNG